MLTTQRHLAEVERMTAQISQSWVAARAQKEWLNRCRVASKSASMPAYRRECVLRSLWGRLRYCRENLAHRLDVENGTYVRPVHKSLWPTTWVESQRWDSFPSGYIGKP